MSQPTPDPESASDVQDPQAPEPQRSKWFLILQSMIARGSCTERILSGAHGTWRRIDDEEYADLQDSLAAFNAAQAQAQAEPPTT